MVALKVKRVYEVYKMSMESGEPVISTIATVSGSDIKGPSAEQVREWLVGGGWPKVTPDEILYGSYVWAAEVPKVTAESLP